MSPGSKAQLVPVGGGDPIPLIRSLLTVGRRESCDICMRFPNISGLHCELSFKEGYWFIRDLNSTNGIKVNGTRVQQKAILPSDEVTIGKRKFVIDYVPPQGRKAPEEDFDDVAGQSLLERAGLEKPRSSRSRRPLNPAAMTENDDDNDEADDDEDRS